MERRGSLIQRFIVLILALCMNLSLANGMAAISQATSAATTTPEALDKLLAPIALYPDALLMQVLAVSVNTQEVLDGGDWLLQDESLQEANNSTAAAKTRDFGPAMLALVLTSLKSWT